MAATPRATPAIPACRLLLHLVAVALACLTADWQVSLMLPVVDRVCRTVLRIVPLVPLVPLAMFRVNVVATSWFEQSIYFSFENGFLPVGENGNRLWTDRSVLSMVVPVFDTVFPTLETRLLTTVPFDRISYRLVLDSVPSMALSTLLMTELSFRIVSSMTRPNLP